MKNTITEMEKYTKGIGSRWNDAEEQISELEDRMVEIIAEEKIMENEWKELKIVSEIYGIILNTPIFEI